MISGDFFLPMSFFRPQSSIFHCFDWILRWRPDIPGHLWLSGNGLCLGPRSPSLWPAHGWGQTSASGWASAADRTKTLSLYPEYVRDSFSLITNKLWSVNNDRVINHFLKEQKNLVVLTSLRWQVAGCIACRHQLDVSCVHSAQASSLPESDE